MLAKFFLINEVRDIIPSRIVSNTFTKVHREFCNQFCLPDYIFNVNTVLFCVYLVGEKGSFYLLLYKCSYDSVIPLYTT